MSAPPLADDQLLAKLQAETAGLLFISETDAEFQVVNWRTAELSPEFMRGAAAELRATAADHQTSSAKLLVARVEEQSFRIFYQKYAEVKDWHDPQQRGFAEQFRRALDLLAANLRQLAVYRVGEVAITIFVVGKSATGKWLGLTTHAVET